MCVWCVYVHRCVIYVCCVMMIDRQRSWDSVDQLASVVIAISFTCNVIRWLFFKDVFQILGEL